MFRRKKSGFFLLFLLYRKFRKKDTIFLKKCLHSSETYDRITFVTEIQRTQKTRLRGQAVKTSPFHGGNTGSIPVGVTEESEKGFSTIS